MTTMFLESRSAGDLMCALPVPLCWSDKYL